jgi:hypothetical protein
MISLGHFVTAGVTLCDGFVTAPTSILTLFYRDVTGVTALKGGYIYPYPSRWPGHPFIREPPTTIALKIAKNRKISQVLTVKSHCHM